MGNSGVFDGYSAHFDEEVRLVILRALNDDPGKQMNDSLLKEVLSSFGISRSRDYLRTQLIWLRDQVGAVRLNEIRSVMVAELTQTGADHLDRSVTLSGVKQPSLPRS